ncbi:hypothetical protein [Aquimarina algiphila]|uniref:hypothetical protein n=1 Tax=Aquimarina algiphila TaxID=2047982 RepID=UPI00232FAA73|nr:hypothetical protein [Aquimarina algiphila]
MLWAQVANLRHRWESSKIELEAVKEDIDDLIINIEDYWKPLSIESNVCFENSHEALSWIKKIKNVPTTRTS